VYLWNAPLLVTLILSILACMSTVGFVLDHSVEADRISYFWYNVSLDFRPPGLSK
ncbi:hypothetical protein B0H19DRAFT_945619, partial [Mycena capillaripes]